MDTNTYKRTHNSHRTYVEKHMRIPQTTCFGKRHAIRKRSKRAQNKACLTSLSRALNQTRCVRVWHTRNSAFGGCFQPVSMCSQRLRRNTIRMHVCTCAFAIATWALHIIPPLHSQKITLGFPITGEANCCGTTFQRFSRKFRQSRWQGFRERCL